MIVQHKHGAAPTTETGHISGNEHDSTPSRGEQRTWYREIQQPTVKIIQLDFVLGTMLPLTVFLFLLSASFAISGEKEDSKWQPQQTMLLVSLPGLLVLFVVVLQMHLLGGYHPGFILSAIQARQSCTTGFWFCCSVIVPTVDLVIETVHQLGTNTSMLSKVFRVFIQ